MFIVLYCHLVIFVNKGDNHSDVFSFINSLQTCQNIYEAIPETNM